MGTEIISGTESPARLEERKDMSYLRDGKSPEGVKAQEKKRDSDSDSQRRREQTSKCSFSPDIWARPTKEKAHNGILFCEC